MIVNIFESGSNENSLVVKYLLENLKWSEKPTSLDIRILPHISDKIGISDLNIHIDYISPFALKNTNYNILIPNLDKFPQTHRDYLDNIDLILVKTDIDRYREYFVGKNVCEIGWGVFVKGEFKPKTKKKVFSILTETNKYKILELAKNWNSINKLNIYTTIKNDDVILDLIGLSNVDVLSATISLEDSINIVVDNDYNYILQILSLGMSIFYVDTKPSIGYSHKYNKYFDNVVEEMDIESISNDNYNKYLKLVNRFCDKFLEVVDKHYFKNFLDPYMPVINEINDYPIVKLIVDGELSELQKYMIKNLDYPVDKLVIGDDNEVVADYCMYFSKEYYYHKNSIKNRLSQIDKYNLVYCCIEPNYDPMYCVSTLSVEPLSKNYRDRIKKASIFYRNVDSVENILSDFRNIKELEWINYYVGLKVNSEVKSEPNGCHFNNIYGFGGDDNNFSIICDLYNK